MGKTSLATRLPAALVGVSLISLIAAIAVAVTTGRDLGQDLTDDRIQAMQGSAFFDVSTHMTGLERTANALAASPQAVQALDAFSEAHSELLSTPFLEIQDEARAVVTTHQELYITPLREAGRDVQLRDISTPNPASLYLQYHYAVDLGVFDAPESIDDARDESAWTDVHKVAHPVYRDVVERRNLVDLYLIEPTDGHIVYSVRKRPDVGTSLEVGPFSGSVVASVAERVRNNPSAGVVTSDLSFYNPALLTPVGVVASPVMDGTRLAGILMLMYDSTPITDILTASGDWDAAGFPESGQTYLVGADGTVRSEPRSFLEDPVGHVAETTEIGLMNAADQRLVEAAGSTVLIQQANDAAVLAGASGVTAVERRTNTIGTETFSATSRVPFERLDWFLVSEVDVESAEGDLDEFEEFLVIGTATFIVALAFLAVIWANQTVRPVRDIAERLASRDSSGTIEVPTRSPIEFHRLAESFESMSTALQDQQADLAQARTDRLGLLRRMLPPTVAARLEDGDLRSMDEVPQATVVVLVVAGLSELVAVDGKRENLAMLDELVAELDGLAERHGLERVKVLGDSYFAACGHDRPLIDHAPRATAFASDARDAVRDLGSAVAGNLDTAIGIHTGPVTVGITGGRRMLYDVWGATVSSAHLLARQARPSQTLVSEETRNMLPETVRLDRVEGAEVNAWSVSDEETEGAV